MGARKAQKWSNFAVFRGPDPTAGGFGGGLLSGLENRGHEGSVYARFWGAVSGAVEAVWDTREPVFFFLLFGLFLLLGRLKTSQANR